MSDARANASIYDRRHKKLRRLNTVVFPAVIIFIVAVYTFFFTSPYWMPDDFGDIAITKIGSTTTDNNRDVNLMSWSYSASDRSMEILLEIDNKAFDGVDRYAWTAMDRKAGYLSVVPIIEKNDFVVLQIQNLPKNISVISLRMDAPETANISFNTLRMYGDPEDNISSVTSIDTFTEAEYEIKRLQIHISNFTNEITELETQNVDLEKQIDDLNKSIEETRQTEAYQTQAEIEDTEQRISRLTKQVGSLQEEISSNNEKIQENQEKINNRSEQIKVLEGGNSSAEG